MYYAVYLIADGTLFSTGSVLPPVLPPEYASKVVDENDVRTKVWDKTLLAFVPRPPQLRAVLTPDEFWDRLTGAELVAIEAASRPNTQAGCQVAVAVKILDRAHVLDVTLQRIRAALQVLVNQRLLTNQRLNEITALVQDP